MSDISLTLDNLCQFMKKFPQGAPGTSHSQQKLDEHEVTTSLTFERWTPR